MTLENLKRGNELKLLMDQTEDIIIGLENFIENIKMEQTDHYYQDGYLPINVSHYSDDRGEYEIYLDRNMGNGELLLTMLEVLKKQYTEYEKMFAELVAS